MKSCLIKVRKPSCDIQLLTGEGLGPWAFYNKLENWPLFHKERNGEKLTKKQLTNSSPVSISFFGLLIKIRALFVFR